MGVVFAVPPAIYRMYSLAKWNLNCIYTKNYFRNLFYLPETNFYGPADEILKNVVA